MKPYPIKAIIILLLTCWGLLNTPIHASTAIENQVIFKLRNATNAANQILQLQTKVPFEKTIPLHLLGAQYYLAYIPNTLPLETAIATLKNQPEIEYTHPNYTLDLFTVPNDTFYYQQIYFTQDQYADLLTLPIKQKVKIAIIDTGIDWQHRELKDSLWQNTKETKNNIDDDLNTLTDDLGRYDFSGLAEGTPRINPPNFPDILDHGTHLAGLIAAKINNSTGMTGINDQVELMDLQIFTKQNIGTVADAALAIQYAIQQNAQIILCGWGTPYLNNLLSEFIALAIQNKIAVIAAVGNDGNDTLYYPAGLPQVWGVGAIKEDGTKASFSNTGSQVQSVSYGVKILSTIPAEKFDYKTGTSQSAALIAAVVSRILAAAPQLSGQDAIQFLKQHSAYSTRNNETGYGPPNIPAIVTALNPNPTPPTPTPSKPGTGNPIIDIILWPIKIILSLFGIKI